jgi:DNA-directed RNA polymerase subunit M/transcription elongation factor TFIIS
MIVTIRVPLCDRCGEIWLPTKGASRDNPELVLRCSKCKSPNWNRSGRPDKTLSQEDYDRLKALLKDNHIAIEDSSLPQGGPHKARRA